MRYCRACEGGTLPCEGGASLRCVKRDPHPAILVGILDTFGGLRYVVTRAQALRHHVRADEVPIVVPNLTVHEPIAWGDIPYVIARIGLSVDEWISRGPHNVPLHQEIAERYKLRCLEQVQRSLDLSAICET